MILGEREQQEEQEKKGLKKLSESFEKGSRIEDYKLSLITRRLKDKKPIYTTYKIDWSEGLKDFFQGIIKKELEGIIRKEDEEIVDYQVVTDSLEEENNIYKYKIEESMSFFNVIEEDLANRGRLGYITDLKSIKNKIWGYAVTVNLSEGSDIHFFKKTSKSKIFTETPGSFMGKVKCKFDPTDTTLYPVVGDTIEFDHKIDCLFYDGHFYILNKKNFEILVNVEEEFKIKANEIIKDLNKLVKIEGINVLETEVEKDKRYLKRVISIASKNDCSNIDKQRLDKMMVVSQELGLDFKMENENIIIESKKDVDTFLKMLDKFYVACMQTEEVFESSSSFV